MKRKKLLMKPKAVINKKRKVNFSSVEPFRKRSLLNAVEKLRPFILTCNNRLDAFEIFVKQYAKYKDTMLQPIVFVGYNVSKTRDRYDSLIQKLDPHIVIEQGRYYENDCIKKDIDRLWSTDYKHKGYINTQKVMTKDFPALALQHSSSDENIIFFEDDGIFSKKFPEAIRLVSERLQIEADFITLYSPDNGYHKRKQYKESNKFIYPINGDDFYGNICVAFNRKVIRYLKSNWEKVEKSSIAWDCRWGISIKKAGFKMFATTDAYLDHQYGYSVLEQKEKRVKSGVFVR